LVYDVPIEVFEERNKRLLKGWKSFFYWFFDYFML
jgi:hypothetical protein